eukprot:m51a1_g13434 hypothetical protein (106) ;mRNA; f:37-1878
MARSPCGSSLARRTGSRESFASPPGGQSASPEATLLRDARDRTADAAEGEGEQQSRASTSRTSPRTRRGGRRARARPRTAWPSSGRSHDKSDSERSEISIVPITL